jgi:hypothetical protein
MPLPSKRANRIALVLPSLPVIAFYRVTVAGTWPGSTRLELSLALFLFAVYADLGYSLSAEVSI